MLEQLLDSRRLEGERPIERSIGPELLGQLVDARDLSDAREAIRSSSQWWGGGSWVLLPASDGQLVGDACQPILDDALIDSIVTRDLADGEAYDARLGETALKDYFQAEPLIAMLVAERAGRAEEWRVQAALPEEDNPWYVAYLAAAGELREDLSEHLLRRYELRPDLRLSDLVRLKAKVVSHPGAADLVSRLRRPRRLTPRLLSVAAAGLAWRSAVWSQDLVTEPTWAMRHWTRRFVGSNVAVVYRPGSVEDLCLAWNLRAAHGFYPGLPLAVPLTENTPQDLRLWATPQDNLAFAGQLKGFGRPFAITSLSVPPHELEEVARAAGRPWQVIPAIELTQSPYRLARITDDTASFRDGSAAVPAFDLETTNLIRRKPPRRDYGAQLHVSVSVRDRPLPHLAALRHDYSFDAGWRGGGHDRDAPRLGQAMRVEMPSGWAVLEAAVRPSGLDIRPSAPGVASAALLQRVGAFAELDALKDDHLLDVLDQLAHRRGISWFRSEIRRMAAAAGTDPDRAHRIEELLQELVIAPAGEEQNDLVVTQLGARLGVKGARAWVEWAEHRGLLARGVDVRCDRCGARHWRTTAELGPPIICHSCGARVQEPFPADQLTFRYRATPGLLEVMSADALPHLLCAAWWVALFRGGLFGVHPGVEFLENGDVIAEADVVLLLADGRLALGECKRRAAGLRQGDIDKLEAVADRVDADFTFYATPQWESDLTPLWATLRRDLPDRRRFHLTGEQLLQPSSDVVSLMGVDATVADGGGANARVTLGQAFKQDLTELVKGVRSPPPFEHYVLASDRTRRTRTA